MSSLIERISNLSKEIEDFPLGKCSPSDDPDKQTAFLFSFRDLVKRFIASAKRIDNVELQNMINELNLTPEYITDAYDLKADLQGIIDFINDIKNDSNSKLKEKTQISNTTANKLIGIICDNLTHESAYNLPMICAGYGLKEGTIGEAFKSKHNYVYSRTAHLSPDETLNLAEKLRGKYPERELDELLNAIQNGDDLNLISKFEDIREVIKTEINKAQFLIWVAVAWFTDKELANILYSKSKEGINVQIIINNDKINSVIGEKLSKYFETYLMPQNESFSKLMHHKFCVIDLKKVIHGSYNWTNKAQYNNETISLIENKTMAEEFAMEFLKVKRLLKNK